MRASRPPGPRALSTGHGQDPQQEAVLSWSSGLRGISHHSRRGRRGARFCGSLTGSAGQRLRAAPNRTAGGQREQARRAAGAGRRELRAGGGARRARGRRASWGWVLGGVNSLPGLRCGVCPAGGALRTGSGLWRGQGECSEATSGRDEKMPHPRFGELQGSPRGQAVEFEGQEKSGGKGGSVLRTEEGQGGLRDVRRLRMERREREPEGRQACSERHREVRAEVRGRGWVRPSGEGGSHGGAERGAASGPLQAQARR